MKELRMYVVSWWSFEKQEACVRSFWFREMALKFALKLAENSDTSFRSFTEYKGIEVVETFNF